MFEHHKIDEIDPQEARRQQQGGAVLLDVRDITGGMSSWADVGLPVVRDEGRAARTRERNP